MPNFLPWSRTVYFTFLIAILYLSIPLITLRITFFGNSYTELLKALNLIGQNFAGIIGLLSVAATSWDHGNKKFVYLSKMLSYTSLAGLVLITFSPFFKGNVITTNSIIILDNIVFISGLSLFLVTILLHGIINFFEQNLSYLGVSNIISIFIYLLTCIIFITSYIKLQHITDSVPIDIHYYYENLFEGFKYLIWALYFQIIFIIFYCFYKY